MRHFTEWFINSKISGVPEDARNWESFIVVVLSLSRVWLFATPWTAAHQAPLSMGFPRQEYWSGLPFSSLGDLPDPGIEPTSPAWQVDSLPLSHLESPENLLDAVKYHRILVQQTYSWP